MRPLTTSKQAVSHSKNRYIRTKKLRTFEAEIFRYAPSKQETSPA